MMNTMPQATISDSEQLQKIRNGIVTADKFINKSYLIDVTDNQVVPLPESYKTTTNIRLYRIEKLIYDKKENINDKLISVYSALLNIDSAALLVIQSNSTAVSFYIGIRSDKNAPVAGLILEKSFLGNFPGSKLKNLYNSDISDILSSVTKSDHPGITKNVSCVTVVPSSRDEDKEKFVQGIEKFVDTMQGSNFTAVFVADPLSKRDLELRKRGLEEMYSALSPYAKTSLAYGDNYSKAVTNGMSESFSDAVNNSINITNGTTNSETLSKNSGFNIGIMGTGTNFGSSRSYTSGTSWSKAVTSGTSETTTTGKNTSDTETNGTSRTLTSEHQNKSVAVLLEKIDEQLKRIKDCEGFGLWECAAYFVADDIQTSVVAANTYKALMLGDKTSVENSYVNTWGIRNQNRLKILEYVRHARHPLMQIPPEKGFSSQLVTPANYISGKELPMLLGMPHKSIAGVSVSSMAEFGRNVFVQNERSNKRSLALGKIHHMGQDEERAVQLDMDSFASHCFITGSTGSGKSNTTYCLLERFLGKVPFLVIEPAKGEYKDAFGAVDGINIFTTSPLVGRMLKLNPFSFDKNIHILEHLDRLIEIFNACWEMYAAMPAILKEAIEKIYIQKGWDLINSVYRGSGEPVFPTFDDLLITLPSIINSSSYSSDTKGDYTGALVTRVKSLTNGISGQIFCDCYNLPDSIYFDENTIIDLSRVGSSETKSLIMGILVLKLSEYRMANATQANSELRHITVIEEAHNLLKQTKNSTAGNNVVGKSVEMICNSIAEMRTYGEGFIIVDQSPTAVDIAAIKNTNTKIIMRLPEKNDCETIGNSVGLNEDQIKELSRLETGIAVVMQNNWLDAVLTHIDAYSHRYDSKIVPISYDAITKLRGAAMEELVAQYIDHRQLDMQALLDRINRVDISSHKKEEMACCLKQIVSRLEKGRDIAFFCESLLNVSGAKGLFDILALILEPESVGDTISYTADSVSEWKAQFEKGLLDYACVSNADLPSMMDYLLFAQEERNNLINYNELQRILDEGVF